MNTYIKKLSLAALLGLLSACVSYPPAHYAGYPAYRSSYAVERGYYAQPVYRSSYVTTRNYYGPPSYRPPYSHPPYYRPPYNHPPHYHPPYNHPPYYRPDPITPRWRDDPSRPHDPVGRDPHRPHR